MDALTSSATLERPTHAADGLEVVSIAKSYDKRVVLRTGTAVHVRETGGRECQACTGPGATR